jgi:hypothetical protein
MSKDGADIRATLWQRLQEMRGSYTDLERLKILLEQWEKDFGSEHQSLVDEMIAKASSNYWREISAHEGTSVDDLIRMQWMTWTEGEFTTEKIPNGIQIYCTKCPMADAYKSISKPDYGLRFHCIEDFHAISGFNPSITLERTKTLMDDDECCNHRYTLK